MFIKTKRMILRPVEKTDAEMLRDSINNPDARQYLSAYLPQTICSEKRWIDRINSSNDEIIFISEDIESKEAIGLFGIHVKRWHDRVCTTGANIWNPDFRDKGYGFEAKMHVLHYAFMTLNMRKVCASALGTNPRSIAYQKKTGAVVEGTLKKQIFKNGEYVDEVLLSVFKDDFLKVWEKFQEGQ